MPKLSPITVQTTIKAPIQTVWKSWSEPAHITQWAFASEAWESPYAENDLRVGGRFKTGMAAKDKSVSFDVTGVYTKLQDQKLMEYDLDDGRHVKVVFEDLPEGVRVTQAFDPETENPREMQRSGWQAILDSFKKHTESIT